jgi:hypothetical protein
MAKDHGPSVKDDKQYEGLRKKGITLFGLVSVKFQSSTPSKQALP